MALRPAVWDQMINTDKDHGFVVCQDCNTMLFANGEGMPKCECTPPKNFKQLVVIVEALKAKSIAEEEKAIDEKKDAEAAGPASKFPAMAQADHKKNDIATAVYNAYRDYVVPAYEEDPDAWDETVLGSTYVESMKSFSKVYNAITTPAEKKTFLDAHVRVEIDQVLPTLAKCFNDNSI